MSPPVRIGYIKIGPFFARPEGLGAFTLWNGMPIEKDLLSIIAEKQALILLDTDPQGSA